MKRFSIYSIAALCTMSSFAQQSESETIKRAFDACFTDLAKAKSIIETVNASALTNLADSTCFDYHYVCAGIAEAEDNHPQAVYHLKETKRLSETSLGIRRPVYLEIMNALASAYESVGDLDNALAIYQEGIVKGLPVRNWDDAKIEFGYLNSGLASIYEKKGWKTEVPDMWRNAWDFWVKKDSPFATYNVFPLYMLEDYYNRVGEYEKALDIDKEMSEYTSSQADKTSPVWCDILYMRGVTLNHQGNYSEAVKVYKEGIDIAKQNKLDGDKVERLYGNMICSLAEYGNNTDIDATLAEIKLTCPSLYSDALFSVSYILEKHHKYQEALAYINQALPLVTGEQEKKYEWYAGLYAHEANNLQQLEILGKASVPKQGTSEWFTHMEKLANAYYGDKQKDKAKDVLALMVLESAKAKQPEDEFMRLVNLLVGCAADIDDYQTVMQYAKDWVEYAKKNYGESSKEYYSSLNTTTIAYIKTQDYKHAKNLLETSGPLCIKLYGKESEQYATELHNNGRVAQLNGDLQSANTFYEQSLSIHSQIKTPLSRTMRTRECKGEVELQLKEQL